MNSAPPGPLLDLLDLVRLVDISGKHSVPSILRRRPASRNLGNFRNNKGLISRKCWVVLFLSDPTRVRPKPPGVQEQVEKLPSERGDARGLETTTMRQVYNTRELEIPADVECDIKSKVVTVKGPRGTSARPVREQN